MSNERPIRVPTRWEAVLAGLAFLASAVMPQSWRVQLHHQLAASIRRGRP